MPASGTITSSDPGDYESNFRDGRIELVFAHWGEYRARLTWVKLRCLHLLRSQENLPRIAYLSLPPERVFIGFPSHPNPPQIWGGMTLQSSDIVLHARGARVHQRTSAASTWGLISLSPQQLAAYSKAVAGIEVVAPAAAKILRPPLLAKKQLLRLHAQACRLAETKPELILHHEAARAMDHDVLLALIHCLTGDDVHEVTHAKRRGSCIMVRFEDELVAHQEIPLRVTQLSSKLGISERHLRRSCAEEFRMEPRKYMRLRRLNMVRAELQRPDVAMESIAETIRRHGFSQPGRFAVLYRQVFGETPSATLLRSRGRDPDWPKMHRRRKRSFSPSPRAR